MLYEVTLRLAAHAPATIGRGARNLHPEGAGLTGRSPPNYASACINRRSLQPEPAEYHTYRSARLGDPRRSDPLPERCCARWVPEHLFASPWRGGGSTGNAEAIPADVFSVRDLPDRDYRALGRGRTRTPSCPCES